MGKVIASITTSVDGFITVPDDSPGCDLGKGGDRLRYCVLGGPWTYDGGHKFRMKGAFRAQGDRNYDVGEPFTTNPALYDPMHHAFKSFTMNYISDQESSVLVFDFHVQAPQ